jgi:deoxyribonuclease-4
VGLIGAHVSIAGGIQNAPGRGTEIDADAIQVFTANQNQWFPKQPAPEEVAGFREGMEREQPQVCVSHDSYLINLGSPDEEKLNRSRQAFLEEIDRCEACGIPYIAFHPGAHMRTGERECLERIAASIDTCLEQRPDSKVMLLLENTAGQGSNVGYRFEHLAEIIALVQSPDRLGVCFDTQHAFAAGYDLRTVAGWKDVLNHFDATLGTERIKAFHINDSKKELGSRVDRHANLGKGFLTLETFWWLVNADQFQNVPMVLETPIGKDDGYAKEIKLLKSLVGAGKPKS